MTMQICINGQLSLVLLIEMLYEKLGADNIKMIQANTDGITYKVRRTHEKLAQEVCDEWTSITKMTLELAVYTKMIIEHVNGYIAVKSNGELKQKGLYEEFTKSNINSSWHKDHSAQIVPHALTKYFVDNIPIEKTIRECTDIFMFYIMERSKSGLGIWSIDNTGKRTEQQRITRHYISRSGVTLYKTSEEDSSKYTKCVSGYYSTIANKHVTHTDFSKYNVDYNYYIRECNKRIYVIEQSQKQTSLFD